jgi:hypothetical protein
MTQEWKNTLMNKKTINEYGCLVKLKNILLMNIDV